MSDTSLELTREQILAFRRTVGVLDQRLPPEPESLRQAAWAGLQDSMPRAALISIHARMNDTRPDAPDDPSLIQLWGPRYSAYVVAKVDLAVFSLGRLPDDERGRQRAENAAERLHGLLEDARMTYGKAGAALEVVPNSLRYGATTGRIVMRWDGARQPTIWMVPQPSMEPTEAQLELARRHLHVFGPTTPAAFATWAGISSRAAHRAFESLQGSLVAVRTPIGDAWLLDSDEEAARKRPGVPTLVRLLPSGDAYYLLHGADRELLVPDPGQRAKLWTSRVWPGAVLVDGEIVGTWRRVNQSVTVQAWAPLPPRTQELVEAEAASLPLPGLTRPIVVQWET